MIDTHCHVQFNAYKDDADAVVKNCTERGIIMNAVGTQIDTSRKAVEFAEKYENVYATIGLHPVHLFETHVDEEESSFNTRGEDFDYEAYKKLGQHPKVIAVGECGLELFHAPEGIAKSVVLQKQKTIFLLQLKLADELGIPLAIHVRDAHDEMIELLRSFVIPTELQGERRNPLESTRRDSSTPLRSAQNDKKIRAVIHCYTGDWEHAQKYLDLGLHLGFTGVITFPARKTNPEAQANLLKVVEMCPEDRILVETDSPYLAPQSYRGQRAEPWMVAEVVKKIAEIRRQSVEDIAEITTNNAKRLFTRIK
ncbi:MAG: TatD family hydrolase [bacterium]|nr:TatD family hydrolase [bacterium]